MVAPLLVPLVSLWLAACGGHPGVDPEPPAMRGSAQRALEVAQTDAVAPQSGRKVALVVGNSAYERGEALANPRNDARDLTVALIELGFEVVEGYDLAASEMHQVLRDFSRTVDGASVALFFYAGHGVQVDGRNYMIPIDAELDSPDDLDLEAVDMNRVLVQLERQPRINVIILDACRNNPMADTLSQALSGRQVGGRDGGLAALDAVAPGTLISFSTQPGATASDGTGRNSPYTQALLSHLRTPGLEIQSMMRRVGADVVKASDGRQVPWQNASLTTDFYFQAPPEGAGADPVAAEPSADRAEIELWLDVKDSGSIEELTAYLERYPEGTFVAVATSRIKGLKLIEEQGPADGPGAQFARLSKRASFVENPSEPFEFYNNARLYDQRGDTANAGKMWAGYVASEPPFVDPHLAYQTHLKAAEGRAGAREAYAELVAAHPDDLVARYASALLQAGAQRQEQLLAHAAAHRDFGPVHYSLSLEVSQRKLGDQTLADKRAEKAHLEAFIAAVAAGQVHRWFLDKGMAETWIADAEERLAALTGLFSGAIDNPIQFSTSRSNAGWAIIVTIMDPGYKDVRVARPGQPFESLGMSRNTHPATGLPMPNVVYTLPGDAGAMTLRAMYIDARDQEQGPFEYAFDPDAELKEGVRSTMAVSHPSTWVVLQDNPGKPGNRLLYFTHLITSRCAIQEVRYGLDVDVPDTRFDLPPCDPAKPYSVPGDATIYLDVPDTTESVSLQVTWYDGEKSKVVTSRFRP